MIDVFNYTNNGISEQVFLPAGTDTWQVWTKPRGCKLIYFYLLGGGAGGGGGTSGTGVLNYGGGGGGSGSNTKGIVPAILIPDTLYIRVGAGGAGGSAGNNGNPGQYSIVSVRPTEADIHILFQSDSVVAQPGTSAGIGGAGGTAFNVANVGYLSNFATYSTLGGRAGASTGDSITFIIQHVTGGASGGRTSSTGPTSNAGGNVTGLGFVPTIPGGSNTGGDGNEGFQSAIPGSLPTVGTPFITTGGSGGGGLFAGTGGRGGNGGFGSGGGGGGAGTTGGIGGNGGDGIVIIAAI